MGFLLRVIVNALAIMLAASILPGIHVDGLVPALVGGLLLGLVNAVVRPVLIILTLPITLVTLERDARSGTYIITSLEEGKAA